MMMDIFSTFDLGMTNFNTTFMWFSLFILPFLMNFMIWAVPNSFFFITSAPLQMMNEQLSRTNARHLKSMTLFISSIFISLMTLNLIGLIPYSFSVTSHLIFTLSIALPMWLSLIVSASVHAPKMFLAHLLPAGAPDWLNPFLVLIETISMLVRPLTLAFRLAANMSAGHIVLSLIGIFSSSLIIMSPLTGSFIILAQMGYFMFEVAIGLIQSFIFCLLISMYSDDHPTT
uniref:ATP synthase subunit a n=1 Tax=Osedax rubiplumus TaxID=283784 RepID=A0A6M4AIJ4_OSERU|nr:ATP synthase subunit 6 [Osedax rubiplumus]QJQ26891.1 ATP synthase subunit 6 [Osedax rubiplumus]